MIYAYLCGSCVVEIDVSFGNLSAVDIKESRDCVQPRDSQSHKTILLH